MAERKLYLGRRMKRLRREVGLNQSAMAAEIGVSPSYLNHLERNQRPVTAQVLENVLKFVGEQGKHEKGGDRSRFLRVAPVWGED